ncbi:hypothetical protein [Streptosporangium sp. NPDC004631]
MTRALAALATAPTLHHHPGVPMTPCWTLTYPCGTDAGDTDGVPHFSTEELAQEEASTYRGPLGTPAPRRLDQPCVVVRCGCCEYVFDEDEDGQMHFVDLAEAAGVLPQYGWTQVSGAWRCETCAAGPCDLEADTHG